MSTDRFVLLGLAHVRSPWFRDVAQWANTAAIPAEFIKCVSPEELRSRLGSGRPFSAVLLDANLPATDRDLIDAVLQSGAVALVVNDGRLDRDWLALGATAVVPAALTRTQLLEALTQHAQPVQRAQIAHPKPSPSAEIPPSWSGRLVAVTGPGGTGSSIAAMALSQALASDPRFRDLVLLADFALDADQAVLHDAREVIPGVQELVEAFRSGSPTTAEIHNLVFTTDRGAYHLLLGLRRHRDWSGIRTRAFTAALEALRHTYRFVIADVDPDIEGNEPTGRTDIDDRNLMARSTIESADAIVAVGEPSVKGLHALTRTVNRLLEFGAPAASIVSVINHAPRRQTKRLEIERAYDQLLDASNRNLQPPVFLPHQSNIDRSVLVGTPFAPAFGKPLANAVHACLSPTSQTSQTPTSNMQPEKVKPGSLGSFFDEDGDEDDD